DSLIRTSAISDYDLGGEGDLFKAPEPIIEQPLVSLDPMTSAMSMISCGEDAISPQELKVTDIESLQNEEFLNDVFYECKNILANEAATGSESSPFSEVLSFNFPVSTDDQNPVAMDNVTPSTGLCSEGDIKTLDDANSLIHYPLGQPPLISERTNEDRMQKLSRYRNKKTKRNFGRKIKEGFGGQSAEDQRKVDQKQ
ncbi:hypothetical protein Tco_1158570, partial [Tanacetum coccineum]